MLQIPDTEPPITDTLFPPFGKNLGELLRERGVKDLNHEFLVQFGDCSVETLVKSAVDKKGTIAYAEKPLAMVEARELAAYQRGVAPPLTVAYVVGVPWRGWS